MPDRRIDDHTIRWYLDLLGYRSGKNWNMLCNRTIHFSYAILCLSHAASIPVL